MSLRVIVTGAALIVLALVFFFGMATTAPRSNDPAALMQTVGMVSGGAGAIGVVMVIVGVLRRKR
jgi:flagellar motor component MotA